MPPETQWICRWRLFSTSKHGHSQLIVFSGTQSDGDFPLGDRSHFYKLQPFATALYKLQGIPMLWQGQEFADNYNLPSSGPARVELRRDTHWEDYRHASVTAAQPEQYVMTLLNFADTAGTISVPFPKAGAWQEMIDADLRLLTISVAADGANQTVTVPSNYGQVFVWPA